MASGIDPKVDYVFKRLFGDEEQALLLVDLLNSVLDLPPGRAVRGVSLLNPFVAQDYTEGKVPILDVRARDDLGRQFLLEMQQVVRPSFARRLLYYWAGGHAEQLLKGERYELLLPTYTLCFVTESLFADAAWHHVFRVYDAEHQVVLCKDLEMHLLELSKFDLTAEQVQTSCERWGYFFKHGAELGLEDLPAPLDVAVIRTAVEVLMRISQSERERQWALERQRAERDAASAAEDARMARQDGYKEGREEGLEEGLTKGREKGRAEGLEKGLRIGRIQLLQQLLHQPETPRAELSALSDTQLEQLEESLKRQMSGSQDANGASSADRT